MSLISSIKQAFTKKESSHKLGISLRQNSLAYCFIPQENSSSLTAKCQQLTTSNDKYVEDLTDFSSHHSVQGQCQLVLSAEQYQMIQVEKPDVPESEIAGALKWQIKDLVPYSPDDMVLDYFYAPVQQGVAEKLYVICTPLNALKPIVSTLMNEDISLTAITVEEFAFANLLPFSDDAQLMLCQQPDEEVFITIVKQGRLCFHRRLRGFAQLGSKSEDELSFGAIDSLSLEIQKSTDYFERQLKQSMIRSIQVILPIATESYIISKLAENTNIKVNPLALPEEFVSSRDMAAAIGATMVDKAVVENKEMNDDQ